MIPFQITFQDFPESDAVWIAVQNRIEKLERFFDRIVRCEVVVSCPHKHRYSDRLYHVQVHIIIPGNNIVVNRNSSRKEAHRDIYVAIRDTFNAVERILTNRIRKVRNHVKFHEGTYEEGKISKILYLDGYGFVIANNGREFYFSQNCITNENFDKLTVGQKVKFISVQGDKGPQVTTMMLTEKRTINSNNHYSFESAV